MSMKEVSKNLIMLVEDDHAIRTDLSMLLEMEGFEVTSAENGAVAVDILKTSQKNPALIILDIMMPVMDGWQFREEQMKIETASSIPVVVMTADGRAADKAKQMKAQGFVQKPIHRIDAFLKTITQYLKAS